jgi:hypothetical protein
LRHDPEDHDYRIEQPGQTTRVVHDRFKDLIPPAPVIKPEVNKLKIRMSGMPDGLGASTAIAAYQLIAL